MTGRLVVPTVPVRPRYESTIIVLPRRLHCISKKQQNWPEFGGRQWWNECGRKQAYFFKGDADCVLLRMGFRPKRDSKTKKLRKLEVYHCEWCEWWHLGHEIPKP